MTDPEARAQRTVVLVPCSGIGKTYGTVTREAAYIVTEDLRPATTQIVPLSLLVLGDAEALAAVRDAQVITLDGCKLACATVNVRSAAETWPGVRRAGLLPVAPRPETAGIAELNAGWALAQALAEEIAAASALAGDGEEVHA
jgi:hypothetical protein